MSTSGKKVVSILDIPLPELEKAYFCRTQTRIKFDRVRSPAHANVVLFY